MKEVSQGKYNYCPQPEGLIDLPQVVVKQVASYVLLTGSSKKSVILSIEDAT